MRNRSQEVYNKGIEATNPQESADIGGLEQARTNAFESINTGANRRGMFFSGIPLAEQSKYVGENYLPAVASLKNRYAGIRSNLYQTLADQLGQYDLDQQKFGRDIYNTEVSQDLEREKLAAAERAAAASSASGGFIPGGGGGGDTPTPTSKTPAGSNVSPEDQTLYNQMFVKGDGSMWNDGALVSDYNATLQSAKYGNVRDQRKIQFYHSVRPDLFGSTSRIGSNAGGGGGGGGGF